MRSVSVIRQAIQFGDRARRDEIPSERTVYLGKMGELRKCQRRVGVCGWVAPDAFSRKGRRRRGLLLQHVGPLRMPAELGLGEGAERGDLLAGPAPAPDRG